MENDKDEELEKGSDIDRVRAILAGESEGLDEIDQLIEMATDPQLKEMAEAIKRDESKHKAALEQWLEMQSESENDAEEAAAEDLEDIDDGEERVEADADSDDEILEENPAEDDIPSDDASDLIDDIREVLAEHEAEKAEDEEPEEDEDEDEDLPDFLKSDEEEEEDEEEDDEDVIEKVLKCYRVPIRIKKGDQQIIYGIISEPNVTDLQGDRLSESEIAKACHKFMQTSQRISKEHAEPAKADIIESYIAPVDFTCGGQSVRKGSWVMAVKVHDPGLWQAIKKGEITGFSIGGHGTRIPI